MKHYNYPRNVIKDIQDYLKENENRDLTDYEVEELDPEEALRMYLEWNGIIGYTSTIISILEAEEDKPLKRTKRETLEECLRDLKDLQSFIEFKDYKEAQEALHIQTIDNTTTKTSFEVSWGCGCFKIKNEDNVPIVSTAVIEVWDADYCYGKYSEANIKNLIEIEKAKEGKEFTCLITNSSDRRAVYRMLEVSPLKEGDEVKITNSWLDPNTTANYPYAIYVNGEWVGSIASIETLKQFH